MADILRSGLKPEGPRNTAESDKRRTTLAHICLKPYGFFKDSSRDESKMLRWIMSLAYRIVFECPLGRHDINLQKKKCSNVSLSEDEAMRIFGDEDLACANANCGWHGKASKTRLLRILPFNWILSPHGVGG